MRHTVRQSRENRTITVDFQNEATYDQLLGDGKAFIECVLAFLFALGFQLKHKATCQGGGCLTRHSHYLRVRLHGVTIWRLQCTTCRAVFTVLPHFVLRYRQMPPEVARDALLATQGGLSLELCAVLYHISPMALSRLVCAFGHHSLVTVLTRCGLPLPVYFLADEKHSRCLTAKVYLPTIVSGRVLWHLGYTAEASAAAFTQSYGEFPHSTRFRGKRLSPSRLACNFNVFPPLCALSFHDLMRWSNTWSKLPNGLGKTVRSLSIFRMKRPISSCWTMARRSSNVSSPLSCPSAFNCNIRRPVVAV